MDDLFDELMGVLGDEAPRGGTDRGRDTHHPRQEPRNSSGLSPEPQEQSRYWPIQSWEDLSRFGGFSLPWRWKIVSS